MLMAEASKVDMHCELSVDADRNNPIPCRSPYHDFLPPLKSLACRFLVIFGSFTLNPSSSGTIFTWHPNLDVSVSPNARSSMSFSSSSGSGILSYMSLSSTMTWQVEHAHDPPHAPKLIARQPRKFVGSGHSDPSVPSISRSSDCAMSSRLSPLATS